jgi:tetratricopeptide (TPR) repeat protein
LPQCCDANELVNALHNNQLFLARLILFALASLLTLVLVGSLNLRLLTVAGILKKSRIWLFVATVAVAVSFGAGLVLGEYLNPLAVWRRLNEWPVFGGPTEFIIANPKVVVCLFVAVGLANQLIYSGRKTLDFGRLRSRLCRSIALPIWLGFVYLLSLASVAFAPLMKGPGPNWLETAIQNYQQREAKIDAIFRDAQDKVSEADRSAPEVAVVLYASARNDFDLILDHYPDSRSAAAIRGGNGNPITLSLVEERLRNVECAARPARACLMQLARDEAFNELTMGLKTALPQFGLAAVGSIMAADKALGNREGAQEIAHQVLEQLAPVSQHSVAFMTSTASLLQLGNALAFIGDRENGIETYQRIVGDAPPASAVLMMRVLSATQADLDPLRRDIEALPAVQQFYFFVDLARRARELSAQTETRMLIDKALSIAPAGAQALYVMDVAIGQDDAHMIWERISASIDLHSVPPPWLSVALRYQALLGDTTTALDVARTLPDGLARARALFEIAIVQAQQGKDGVKQILEQADASADPARWSDPALALAAIEAHAWAGDATTAVMLSRKMANQAYRALALARIACALSKLRHPFLFFTNRPAL